MSENAHTHCERGQNLVEMVLVLPLLLVLLGAIVDFGRALYAYGVVTNAAREGARYGARFPFDRAGITAAVRQEAAQSGVPPASLNVTVTGLNAEAGEPIHVTVRCPFPLLMGDLLGIPNLTLTSSTTMVVFGIEDE